MDLRRLIIEWIKTNGGSRLWLLGVYHYLIGHGADPDDALKAMELFVDEICASKAKHKLHVVE
jgi:hypothetical protein